MRWFWPVLWIVNALTATGFAVASMLRSDPVPTFVYVAALLVFLDKLADDWPVQG